MIQVSQLVKDYGASRAVRGISFSISEGEIVGFLGPNGAGKSTTMNIITGCLEATSGTVTVGGMDSREHPAEVRRLIGYLPEQPPLYPDMTVEEYLRFVFELKRCQMDRTEHLSGICARVGLTEVTGRLIRNLSKGYRQRVGLAQAMVGDPQVLILDEPTVGLDPKQIIEIRDVIRELGRDRTVLLSSHILPEVQEVCDRVIVLHDGKIAADGTTASLAERITGETRLEMVIEGDSTAVLTVLRAVPGTASAELTHRDGKKSTYCIAAEPGTDIRRDVFESLSQNRMAILSMQQAEVSLEDIFLRLTADGEPSEQDETAPSAPKTAKKRRLFRRKGE